MNLELIIAVAAFALSLWLAVIEIRRNLLRVKANDVKLIFAPSECGDNGNGVFFLRVILSNKSSLPLGLFSTEFVFDNATTVRSEVVHNVTVDRSNILVKHIPYVQQFPLMFAPFESRELIIPFDNLLQKKSLHRLSEKENHSERELTCTSFEARFLVPVSSTVPHPSLKLLTARGTKCLDLPQIELASYKYIEDFALRSAIQSKDYEYFE